MNLVVLFPFAFIFFTYNYYFINCASDKTPSTPPEKQVNGIFIGSVSCPPGNALPLPYSTKSGELSEVEPGVIDDELKKYLSELEKANVIDFDSVKLTRIINAIRDNPASDHLSPFILELDLVKVFPLHSSNDFYLALFEISQKVQFQVSPIALVSLLAHLEWRIFTLSINHRSINNQRSYEEFIQFAKTLFRFRNQVLEIIQKEHPLISNLFSNKFFSFMAVNIWKDIRSPGDDKSDVECMDPRDVVQVLELLKKISYPSYWRMLPTLQAIISFLCASNLDHYYSKDDALYYFTLNQLLTIPNPNFFSASSPYLAAYYLQIKLFDPLKHLQFTFSSTNFFDACKLFFMSQSTVTDGTTNRVFDFDLYRQILFSLYEPLQQVLFISALCDYLENINVIEPTKSIDMVKIIPPRMLFL